MTAFIASRKKRICHRFLKSGKIIADTEDSKNPEATQRVSIFIVIVVFVATVIGLILLLENIKYTLPCVSLLKPYGTASIFHWDNIKAGFVVFGVSLEN